MKVLTIEDGYKIFPSQKGNTYLINNRFPLHWLVYYLSLHKHYNKELTNNHIKTFYDLDISDLLDNDDVFYWVWNKDDIYKEHLTKYPRKEFNEDSRDYFNSRGRSYFLKFIKNHNEDFVNGLMKTSVVHHVHPLYAGGTNRLENLICISDHNHDLLHMNPMEIIEKYCHQAVDYLWYLYSAWDTDKNKRILDKYKITEIVESNEDNHSFIVDVYLSAIKSEMMEFYKYIENKQN
jgi:hypothetical protein